MTRLRDIYGPGFTQADYLRALRAGHETGWWDHNGIPAPWPGDFLDARLPNNGKHTDTPQQNGDQPPF